MSISYATLPQLEAELQGSNGGATDQARLLDYARQVSARMDEYKAYEFAPRQQAIYHSLFDDVRGGRRRRPATLVLRQPFLAIDSIAIRDEALTQWDGVYANQASADYYADPLHDSPKRLIRRLNGQSWTPSTSSYASDYENAILVTGLTGYRTRYPQEGWQPGSTLSGSIATDATSLAVNSGANFSPGALLRVGSELMLLTAVATNTLTVTRGSRGSTAAAHSTGAAVEVWVPEPAIVRACARWASYLLRRRGNFERYSVDGLGGGTSMPEDMPREVKNILDELPTIPLPVFAA